MSDIQNATGTYDGSQLIGDTLYCYGSENIGVSVERQDNSVLIADITGLYTQRVAYTGG